MEDSGEMTIELAYRRGFITFDQYQKELKEHKKKVYILTEKIFQKWIKDDEKKHKTKPNLKSMGVLKAKLDEFIPKRRTENDKK